MSESATRLEIAERLVKLVKELGLLAILAYVLYVVLPLVPLAEKALANAEFKKIKVGEVELELDPKTAKSVELDLAAAKLQSHVNAGNHPLTDGDRVSADKQATISALEAVNELRSQARPTPTPGTASPGTAAPAAADASFWVYLGVIDAQSRLGRNSFGLQRLPTVNQTLQASDDVYRRASAPTQTGDKWQLGPVLGLVRGGQKVVVREVFTRPGDTPGTLVAWVAASWTR